MQLGPFHFSNDISLGSILTLLGMLWVSIKYLRHYVADIKLTNERTTELWKRFNGANPDDPNGWFNRLNLMENKVNQMWERLRFNRLHFDDTKSRTEDRGRNN